MFNNIKKIISAMIYMSFTCTSIFALPLNTPYKKDFYEIIEKFGSYPQGKDEFDKEIYKSARLCEIKYAIEDHYNNKLIWTTNGTNNAGLFHAYHHRDLANKVKTFFGFSKDYNVSDIKNYCCVMYKVFDKVIKTGSLFQINNTKKNKDYLFYVQQIDKYEVIVAVSKNGYIVTCFIGSVAGKNPYIKTNNANVVFQNPEFISAVDEKSEIFLSKPNPTEIFNKNKQMISNGKTKEEIIEMGIINKNQIKKILNSSKKIKNQKNKDTQKVFNIFLDEKTV